MQVRRLGLIADTHGRVQEDVITALCNAQVEMILHAGDIGSWEVIEQLEDIAPVVAVAGNGDEQLVPRLPWDLRLHLCGLRILLCHWYDNFGRIHPEYRRIAEEWSPDLLVYGHTHEALVERRDGILFLNPGYAGPPEPSRVRSVATVDLTTLVARICPL